MLHVHGTKSFSSIPSDVHLEVAEQLLDVDRAGVVPVYFFKELEELCGVPFGHLERLHRPH